MTEQERRELCERWNEIHGELLALEDLKVIRTHEPLVDLAAREAGLLAELDRIEGTLGVAWIEQQRRERGEKGR